MRLSDYVIIITLIGSIFAGYFYIDNRYAVAVSTNKSINRVEQRLDYKIESDVLRSMRERLWQLEELYGDDMKEVKDQAIKKEIKELREDIELQKVKIKAIQEEMLEYDKK